MVSVMNLVLVDSSLSVLFLSVYSHSDYYIDISLLSKSSSRQTPNQLPELIFERLHLRLSELP